jgi:hypothetical protein
LAATGRNGARFTVWIHKTLVFAASLSDAPAKDVSMSSISSVTALPPASQPDSSPPPKTPDPQNDDNSGDADASQPPVLAALPPGQGTRIDQLV